MRVRNFLEWPFLEPGHRELAARLDAWAVDHVARRTHAEDRASVDEECRALVRLFGSAGWTRYSVPYFAPHAASPLPAAADAPGDGQFDVRGLTLIRETLAWYDGLADFAFAMQGLGSGAISIAGSPELQGRYLPRVAAGDAIAAFALSERQAGSDVAAIQCSARLEGGSYVLDGEKTWVSNGGIADF
jgi:alkylation response protein AidB-like acyl-CoA dehydrogenase